MFRTRHNQPTTSPHRKGLAVTISAGLLSIAGLTLTATPAQAVPEDLLAGSNCVDQDQYFGELHDNTYGWYPGWANVERQRKSIVCLMNYARARYNTLHPTAQLPKLSACSQDATYCDIGTVFGYTRQQVANFTTAAQWKAMHVDYMCTTAAQMLYTDPVTKQAKLVDDPHRPCNEAPSYWANWWVANNPASPTTPRAATYSVWAENLTAGWTSSLGLVTPRIIVNRWLLEPADANGGRTHRDHILDARFHYVGVGVTPAVSGTTIASGYPWYWTSFRQVISADFID